MREVRSKPLLHNTMVIAVRAFFMSGDRGAAHATGFRGLFPSRSIRSTSFSKSKHVPGLRVERRVDEGWLRF
jgi:hypothetical protein